MTFGLGTFSAEGSPPFPGIVMGTRVIRLSDLAEGERAGFAAPDSMLQFIEGWDSNFAALNSIVASGGPRGAKAINLGACRVHLPWRPRQIFCSGANYRKHVIDLIVDRGSGNLQHLDKDQRLAHAIALMDERERSGKPFVFTALPTALAGATDDLVLPYEMQEPDWELELAVVVAKPARRVPVERALEHVAGYTIANDISARDFAERPDVKGMGLDWLASKSAPGFKIIGPFITPAAFASPPDRMRICLKLNGRTMQDEATSDMIFPVERLVSYISHCAQLLPGDIILTGSPAGNGTHYQRFLRHGDVMDGAIEGLIGTQHVRCVLEEQAIESE